MKHTKFKVLLATSGLLFGGGNVAADSFLDWHTTELQYQYGKQDIPTFAGGGHEYVSIGTLQHANGWKYGDTFAFVDFSNGSESGSDVYTELYSNFSFGKISGKKVGAGPLNDVGFIVGYNYADDAKVHKYLPGIRTSWDVPMFAFFNVDVTAYLDDSRGVGHGGAPKEDNSYMVDISWALPWQWGNAKFSFEGHAEYIGSRDNEFGEKVSHHVLAQPQLRYDLGNNLFDQPDKLFVGLEFQYWENKLGDKDTDERMTQVLAVYRF